jgi:phosphoglycolate phosphatase
VLLTREDVTHVKPHPEQLLKALAAVGSGSDTAAMVGDHPMDMEAAHRAGALAIGVLSGHSTEQALRDAGAALIYADVIALADDLLTGEGPCPN